MIDEEFLCILRIKLVGRVVGKYATFIRLIKVRTYYSLFIAFFINLIKFRLEQLVLHDGDLLHRENYYIVYDTTRDIYHIRKD